jgi:hypothetical protein
MKFDDYHRTVVGYHGTKLSVAREIVQLKNRFEFSRNASDWLGHGIYFWEYAPQQAYWWAKRLSVKRKWNEPIAILGSMIRLGVCFDLLDPENVRHLKYCKESYFETEQLAGRKIRANANHKKYLDCSIFNYFYRSIDENPDLENVDSARAVYVPTGPDRRIWERSWINEKAHVQLCVRNVKCILGTWLHYFEEEDQNA